MENTKESRIIYESPSLTWESEKRFLIPEVSYRGETADYRLFEEMTTSMNQNTLAEFYETEKAKGNPHPTDMPLIQAICTRAHTLKDENLEISKKLRSFLKNSFRRYPNTLTRIIYNTSGKDRIIHNYGTLDEYSLDGKVVGPDNWIDEISDKSVLEKLLGTSNIEQINEVSQWLNGTNTYLWRLNSKPKTKDERVARFGAGDSTFSLGCGRDPLSECPAFRVLRVD